MQEENKSTTRHQKHKNVTCNDVTTAITVPSDRNVTKLPPLPLLLSPRNMALERGVNGVDLSLLHGLIALRHLLERPYEGLVLP